MKLRHVLLILGLIPLVLTAEDQTVTIVEAPLQKVPQGELATEEEQSKIMEAFVAREPQIKLFASKFPGVKAEIHFVNRATHQVRYEASGEVEDGKYFVTLLYALRLDASLGKVLEHKGLMLSAQYVPPDMTNVSQLGPVTKLPLKDLKQLCDEPAKYLEEKVPKK